MAGSHVSVNIEREEEEVDKLIKFLQQFKPRSAIPKPLESPVLKTPKQKNSRSTRGVGRIPKNQPSTEVPILSPTTASAGESLPASAFEVVLDCLGKLNDRNKVLNNRLVELDSQVQAPKIQIQELVSAAEPLKNSSSASHNIKEVADRVERLENFTQSDSLQKVVRKVEKIENNINSHLLLCRGPRVSSKIDSHRSGRLINLNQIKAEICSEICGGTVPEISVDSLSMTLHGKDKNMLKIECANISTRQFLIKQARTRRPAGIYIIEFLPQDKVHVYRNLHKLRKENTKRKISSIFIRGTNIYCKTEGSEHPSVINTLSDIDDLKRRLNSLGPDIPPVEEELTETNTTPETT